MLPGVHIPVVLACPGCSMFNLLRFQFKNPSDAKWAMLIVLSALAVPVLLYVVGFRLGEKRIVTPGARWGYTAGFFGGWFVTISAGFHSPNFAAFLLHWLYLPLVVQWNVLIVFAWSFPPLMLLSGLVIPAVCCFYTSKWMLAVDRKIVWRGYPRPAASSV